MLIPLLISVLKMLYRDRQALFWAMAFPLIFVAVFSLFDFDTPPSADLVVVDLANDEVSRELMGIFSEIAFLSVTVESESDSALDALSAGDLGYVLIIPDGLSQAVGSAENVALRLFYNETAVQTNSIVRSVLQQSLDRMNLAIQGAPPILGLDGQGVRTREIGYYDFLLPGFVGMGVMIYGIIGMATVMALYRQQRVLKRIRATPLKVRTFFAAQVLGYLILALAQAAIILAAGILLFGANVYGNLIWVFPLVVLANLTFLNIGFIVGSYAKTVEAASGMGNAIAMPMMFLSGVFFPVSSLPDMLQKIVQFSPLTPLLHALRGTMLEAQPIWDFPYDLALLAAWVVFTAIVAMRVFRFD